MDGQLFTNLIEFSWTLCSFLFAVQGWLFLQEFKGNKIPKKHHFFLAFAGIANTIATCSVFVLLSLVLNESLSETKNFVADNIKAARLVFTWSIFVSMTMSIVALVLWLSFKNGRQINRGQEV